MIMSTLTLSPSAIVRDHQFIGVPHPVSLFYTRRILSTDETVFKRRVNADSLSLGFYRNRHHRKQRSFPRALRTLSTSSPPCHPHSRDVLLAYPYQVYSPDWKLLCVLIPSGALETCFCVKASKTIQEWHPLCSIMS